jgi:ferredoxin-NADP reductase
MLLDNQTGIVIRIEDETHNTKRFYIQVQGTTNFEFKPGQFITLDLPIHEKKNKRLKSYSVASAPNGTNIIELVIVLLPGGLGTTYLFTQLQIGDTLTFKGPQGHFILPEIIPQDLFLICTGTGIAPFRSMVHYIQQHQLVHQNIYLLYGTRTQQDLLYAAELTELQSALNGFQYLPVLSRESWNGHTGYVHEVYKNLCINKPNAEFMLCGWRAMIDEARATLATLGYEKNSIHFELYG